MLNELRAFRASVEQRFERHEREMREFRCEVADGFREVHRAIDRLGARWGIRNESVFRPAMAALLEQSFGVSIEQRVIAGEQFDVMIYDHQHILVEIAASVGRTIGTRLERKRRLYEERTGVRPARVILATGSIHSRRAQELRENGIEVIEPEAPGTELPAGAATSLARVQAADRPAAAAGIATSAPKGGGGAQPAAHRSGRLVTPATAPPQPRVRSRAIPAAVRRQVWERDRGCCSYVDRGSWHRCGSRHERLVATRR